MCSQSSSPNEFKSILAPLLQDFLDGKLACGYRYTAERSHLHNLDRFLLEKGLQQRALPKALACEWLQRSEELCVIAQQRRAGLLRQFAEFISWRGCEAFVPNLRLYARQPHSFAPYIFTQEQIRRLLAAADNLPRAHISPLRPVIMPEIFRLLYGCGLRVNEALRLRVKDANLREGVLTVLDTKFRKDRLVPTAPELTERLTLLQKKLGRRKGEAPFFPVRTNCFYDKRAIYDTFRRLLWESGIPHHGRGKGPRVHDLRHTFAVHRMMIWYREGVDLNAKLPILAAYMGHRNIVSTQKYLHLTLEFFADVASNLNGKFGMLIPEEADS